METIRAMTINELKQDCEMAIANGFGDKQIYISADDEGNDFHPLYYTFTTDIGNVGELLEFTSHGNVKAQDIVILG